MKIKKIEREPLEYNEEELPKFNAEKGRIENEEEDEYDPD